MRWLKTLLNCRATSLILVCLLTQSFLSTYTAITSMLQMNKIHLKDYNSLETSSQGIAAIQNSLAFNQNTGQHIHIYMIYKI